jgi:hypothetical protein
MREQCRHFLEGAVLETMGNFIGISLLRFESGTGHVRMSIWGGEGYGMELRICTVHSFIFSLVGQLLVAEEREMNLPL